jgi:hypothetical protein
MKIITTNIKRIKGRADITGNQEANHVTLTP